MTEFSMLPWQTQTGVGDGPLAGYNQDQSNEFFRDFSVSNVATAGPLSGIDNELEVTGAASPLSVNTGKAYAYGRYWNITAPVNLAVTTPTAPAAPTGGRVVLRTDWAGNQTRLLANQSPDGVIAPPALVQVAGTTWDIPLASYEIDGFGNIKLTDERHFNISPSAGTVRLRHLPATAGVASSIAFANIQQDLTHLLLKGSIENIGAPPILVPPYPDLHVNFNNDFGANYTYVSSTFSTAGTTIIANTNDTKVLMGPVLSVGVSSQTKSFLQLDIHNYTNITTALVAQGISFKCVHSFDDGGANRGYTVCVGVYVDAAITTPISEINLSVISGGLPLATMDWGTSVIDVYGLR